MAIGSGSIKRNEFAGRAVSPLNAEACLATKRRARSDAPYHSYTALCPPPSAPHPAASSRSRQWPKSTTFSPGVVRWCDGIW